MDRFTLRLPDDSRADLKPGYGWDEIAERLAAYEETGLEPEECAKYAQAEKEGRYIVLKEPRSDGVHRLEEIARADIEGRLVVRPVSEIEKIIESLQEQADIYNARAKELLVEEDGQVSQYTWAVSLRETYRRIIKTLDDLIS